MGLGSFNVIAWAQEMGLVSLREAEIIERIQPVMSLGDFSDLVPQHEPPSGFAGGTAGAVVGQRSMIELQSLGPGGAVVKATFGLSVQTLEMQIGAPLLAGAGTIAGQTSDDAPLSILRVGASAVAGDVSALTVQILFDVPIFVPRGQALRVFPAADNVSFSGTFWYRDVPAAEAPRS